MKHLQFLLEAGGMKYFHVRYDAFFDVGGFATSYAFITLYFAHDCNWLVFVEEGCARVC